MTVFAAEPRLTEDSVLSPVWGSADNEKKVVLSWVGFLQRVIVGVLAERGREEKTGGSARPQKCDGFKPPTVKAS